MFPNRTPTERHPSTEPSTSHPLKIHLSLRVPGKSAPSMFPNRVSMEGDTLSPEPLVYLFICLPEPSYKMGENIRSPSTEPHTDTRPTYSGVWPGSPGGSLLTLLSLLHYHAFLSMIPSTLAWVDQSPVSQCVS
jgi:hypothetical protein